MGKIDMVGTLGLKNIFIAQKPIQLVLRVLISFIQQMLCRYYGMHNAHNEKHPRVLFKQHHLRVVFYYPNSPALSGFFIARRKADGWKFRLFTKPESQYSRAG